MLPANVPLMSSHKFSRKVENLIARIRGLPLDRSRSRDRGTTPASESIDRLMLKYRVGMATPEEAIREAWVDVVGGTNAEFCHPLRIEGGAKLVVGVTSPVVRQELLFHQKVILSRIRGIPACRAITSIAFRGA